MQANVIALARFVDGKTSCCLVLAGTGAVLGFACCGQCFSTRLWCPHLFYLSVIFELTHLPWLFAKLTKVVPARNPVRRRPSSGLFQHPYCTTQRTCLVEDTPKKYTSF